MQQKQLVIDSSTLIAFERVGLLNRLEKLNVEFLVPNSVFLEIGSIKTKNMKVEKLRGASIKKTKELLHKGFGKGEAECIVLAEKLKSRFIVCDDRKFIRKMHIEGMKMPVAGFSLILHMLKEKDIWGLFDLIIEKNNWERSEVEVANYVFLKELGY